MERIKQALELAREEREGRIAPGMSRRDEPVVSTAEVERVRAAEIPAVEPPLRAAASANGLTNIRYTQTRVFKPARRTIRKHRLLVDEGNGEAMRAYKLLRTRILQRMSLNRWQTLAVTSPGIAEGKTLTAVNLAISLSKEVNHTVLLVDLDLRNPSVHRCFDHEPELGIADHLLDDAPLQRVLFNPGVDRLVVAPGRESIVDSSELLSSPRMTQLVKDLRRRYPSRLLLFDLPPVVGADDTLAFSPFVDCALLVVEEGKTPKSALVQALHYLQDIEVLGTVLNKSSEPTPRYYA